MTKRAFLTLALLAGSAFATDAAPPAKPPVKQTQIGTVTINWARFTGVVGNYFNFSGGVHAVSETYDLTADAIKFDFALDGKSIAQAIATGTPGKQIVGQFTQTTPQGTNRTFIYADRAVYKPDASRPEGGQIDFTGHVTMRVLDPQALVGPGILAVEEPVTIFLGRNTPGEKPNYPRLETGAAQATLTPKDSPPK